MVGTSGCGKTYVATVLAARLGVPYINNDAIIWRAGWQETPHEERIAEIDAATQDAGWTFDGNLAARHVDDRIVLERCDTIVWLDLPRREVWSQVFWRTARRVVTREALWHGNRETLHKAFGRDSIIWFSMRTFGRRRRAYAALFSEPAFADRQLIRLSSRRQVNRWLASVKQV